MKEVELGIFSFAVVAVVVAAMLVIFSGVIAVVIAVSPIDAIVAAIFVQELDDANVFTSTRVTLTT